MFNYWAICVFFCFIFASWFRRIYRISSAQYSFSNNRRQTETTISNIVESQTINYDLFIKVKKKTIWIDDCDMAVFHAGNFLFSLSFPTLSAISSTLWWIFCSRNMHFLYKVIFLISHHTNVHCMCSMNHWNAHNIQMATRCTSQFEKCKLALLPPFKNEIRFDWLWLVKFEVDWFK